MSIVFRVAGAGSRKSIARVGDNHDCHKISSGNFHIGGNIMSGSSFVSIDGVPVARVGDKAHCLPFKDTIKHGIDNFTIDGRCLAVAGSHCEHGGVVTEGAGSVFVEELVTTPAEPAPIIPPEELHWVKGQLIDAAPGTQWFITHSNGTEYSGMVDEDGQTDQVAQLPAGNVKITFGPRKQLKQELVTYRKKLKRCLDNIIQSNNALNEQKRRYNEQDKFELSKFLHNNAIYIFTESAGESFLEALEAGGKGIAHLFKDIAQSQARADQARHDIIHGDRQDLERIEQEVIVEGMPLIDFIEGAKNTVELLYRDPLTRYIIANFVYEYLKSDTLIVAARNLGYIVGGLAVIIPLLIVTKNPSLVAPEVLGTTYSEIVGAGEAAAKINKILDALEETTEITTTKLDKKHLTVIRPRGIDEGAVHASEAKLLPEYKATHDLEHFAGEEHALPKEEAPNFPEKPTSTNLEPSKKIYRVIDNSGKMDANGSYWLTELPKSKAEWRRLFAVKKNWNGNGFYVEYIVPEEGIPAWEGQASSQHLKKEGFPDWYLEGGGKQIFIPQSRSIIPKDLELIPTNWSD